MTMATASEIIKNDQSHVIHPLHHSSEAAEPLVIVEGHGAVIKDIHGNEYIDGLAGLWNVSVGHGREELARAAFEQMKKLAYFSNYVGNANIPAVELATKIVSLSYPNMAAVFFTCGGAEANESAFKTARFYWKAKGKPDKVKVIARQNAYHGVTLQAMSATGMAPYWKMFEPRVPGFLHIQAPYQYRFQGARAGETVGQAAARELEEAILREGADTVAAFIAEPIIGGGGVLVPAGRLLPAHPRDLHQARRAVHRRRGHHGLLPDRPVVRPDALERPAGHPVVREGGDVRLPPLGGIVVSRDIFEAMNTVKPEDRWMHAYTYSGHPTCCAVGLANIGIMERERLWERSAQLGTRLYQGLLALQKELPAIGDVRGGKGLLAARGAGLRPDDEGRLPGRPEGRAAGPPGHGEARLRDPDPELPGAGRHVLRADLLLAAPGHHRAADRPRAGDRAGVDQGGRPRVRPPGPRSLGSLRGAGGREPAPRRRRVNARAPAALGRSRIAEWLAARARRYAGAEPVRAPRILPSAADMTTMAAGSTGRREVERAGETGACRAACGGRGARERGPAGMRGRETWRCAAWTSGTSSRRAPRRIWGVGAGRGQTSRTPERAP